MSLSPGLEGVASSTNAHLVARMAEAAPAPLSTAQTYGGLTELTGPLSAFTHGLNGVNQPLNFVFVEFLGLSLAGVVAATLLFRWTRMASDFMRYHLTMSDRGSQKYWAKNRNFWWPWLKRHLLFAPLFKVRHNRELQLSRAIGIGTLPSRFHTLLLTVYFVANMAYMLLMLDYSAEPAIILANLRGRSGFLSAINIVPTVLFALRNNPLITLLRVSYDTFNLLHRWCARMATLQAVIHTIAWAVNTFDAGGVQAFDVALATSNSYKWGMVGTCAFSAIVVLATSALRHAFYETFINLHRVLVLLALIAIYIHIEQDNLPQLPYMRAIFAMWAGEWTARWYHIIYHNISLRNGMTQVLVEALPSEACRVTFQLRRPWKFVPGAHVHVYLPSISGWSSHPFSVAWATTTAKVPAVELDIEKVPANSMMSPDVNIMTNSKGGAMVQTEVDLCEVARSQASTSLSIVIRARTGMTRKLYNRASASPTGQIILRGGIEGPYGGHEPLGSYGTVILFAGGVGITHGTSYLKALLTDYANGACSTRKILLVWSVPNTEALEWVRPWMDQVLRMEGRKEVLRIQLFVTKPRHQGEIRSNTGTVQMFPGRCNPVTIIEREMQDRIGAVAVTVCGPGAFADTVRAAARSKVQAGTLDFIEEAFTY